ncbi:hypothetical protein R3P38DRAFT_3347127, partial [Favolaschia claudopus]
LAQDFAVFGNNRTICRQPEATKIHPRPSRRYESPEKITAWQHEADRAAGWLCEDVVKALEQRFSWIIRSLEGRIENKSGISRLSTDLFPNSNLTFRNEDEPGGFVCSKLRVHTGFEAANGALYRFTATATNQKRTLYGVDRIFADDVGHLPTHRGPHRRRKTSSRSKDHLRDKAPANTIPCLPFKLLSCTIAIEKYPVQPR